MFNNQLRSPHQMRFVFLAVMLLLASVLGLLGWRLTVQDHQLSEKRLDDQREAAASMAVIALEQRMSAVERDLARIETSAQSPLPPAGSVFVRFTSDSVRSWPENGLVFLPDVPEESEAPDSVFAAAIELEMQKNDYAGAIALLKGIAVSDDPKIRATALVSIAGNQRKVGQMQESLETYARLAEMGPVSVGGLPAALAGRLGTLKVLEQQGNSVALSAAARKLAQDLASGQWPISFGAHQSILGETRRLLPDGEQIESPRIALAEGVAWLWDKWKDEGADLGSGRDSLSTSTGPVLVVWRISENGVAGFAAGADSIENSWLAEMRPALEARDARIVLTDSAGPVLGAVPRQERAATQLASATGLPWTVQAVSAREDTELRSRRRLFVAGMVVLLVLILIGGWFIGHAVEKQLAVARLQSDFVSVVSHEFRTPLTALCQLSELLKRGRLTGEDERRESYNFLHQESNRLRRLVESLLDFGRLESGKMQFRFEETDAAAFVGQAAAEFAEGQPRQGIHLELSADPGPHWIRADRETLRCVFWNLLENAVKYSPNCDTVWVGLGRKGGNVEIAVSDKGAGIPRAEQRTIFEKFVRGSAAQAGNVRGTGIGLATTRQIVRAHGGSISVESEPGKGSTFRVSLPLAAGHGSTKQDTL